jgi:hypothetical protein
MAAQQLSDPNEDPIHEKRQNQVDFNSNRISAVQHTDPDWKTVVQKRIRDKTRIISKVKQQGLYRCWLEK